MKRTDNEKAIRKDFFAAVALVALAIERSGDGLGGLSAAIRTLGPHGGGGWPGGGGGSSKPLYGDDQRAARAAALANTLAEALDAPAPPALKTEVTIEVLGGVVDSVESTGPVIVKVIDHDNEATSKEDATSVYNFGERES